MTEQVSDLGHFCVCPVKSTKETEKGHPKHKQVQIEWNGKSAEVDEELAPIILALWKFELSTNRSCQEDRPGTVWIEFKSSYDAEVFMGAMLRDSDWFENIAEDPSFHARMMGQVDDRWKSSKPWEFDVYMVEIDEPVDDEGEVGEELPEIVPTVYLSVSIRFPRTDLPLVERRLKEVMAEVGLCEVPVYVGRSPVRS